MRPRAIMAALVALLAALPLVTAAPPPAVSEVVAAAPGAWISTYATPVVAVPVGGALTFVNGDIMRHDVVSHAYGPDDEPWCEGRAIGNCPLFRSALVGLGGSAEVQGLENLEPLAAYTFYCTLHPGMRGTLVALPGPVDS